MYKFSLYMETIIPIMLNIFDTKDFLESLLKEDFLWSFLDVKIKYMRRLLEDFASGGKPKILLKLMREYVRRLPKKSFRNFSNHKIIN